MKRPKIYIALPSRPPDYVPGSGPPLQHLALQPTVDSTAYIDDRILMPPLGLAADGRPLPKRMKYLIGWRDLPAARLLVSAMDILDYVSPHALEEWEYNMELELDAERARLAAERQALKSKARDEAIGAGVPVTERLLLLSAERKRGRPRLHTKIETAVVAEAEDSSGGAERGWLRGGAMSLSTPKKRKMEDFLDGNTSDDESPSDQLRLDIEQSAGPRKGPSRAAAKEEKQETASATPQLATKEKSVYQGSATSKIPSTTKVGMLEEKLLSEPSTARESMVNDNRYGGIKPKYFIGVRPETKVPLPPIPWSTSITNPTPKAGSSRPLLVPQTATTTTTTPLGELGKAPALSKNKGHGGTRPITDFLTSTRRSGSGTPQPPARALPSRALPTAKSQAQRQTQSHAPQPKLQKQPQKQQQQPKPKPQSPSPQRRPQAPQQPAKKQNIPPPPPPPVVDVSPDSGSDSDESIGGEQSWAVERLEDMELYDVEGRGLVRYFKVRWEGDWPPSQNPTWEPEENIPDDIVRDFCRTFNRPTPPVPPKGGGGSSRHRKRRDGHMGGRDNTMNDDSDHDKEISGARNQGEAESDRHQEQLESSQDGLFVYSSDEEMHKATWVTPNDHGFRPNLNGVFPARMG